VVILGDVDHFHQTARLTLWIGEKECWGRGYGTEATILILNYGFTALGLHNIGLDVTSANERGLRAYQQAGFRVVGRRREAFRLGDRVFDRIYMDCLATEFPCAAFPSVLEQVPLSDPTP
jgi:diamine N-acetyltransferase